MRDHYTAVVVGSGFGGAVSACRLAQAGIDVAVLERGRRYHSGDFPRVDADPERWLWRTGGLFDVRPCHEMVLVQSAAYGGGSHIYANVHLRVPDDGFSRGWPSGWDRAALDPYYDLVAHMLEITTVDAAPDHPAAEKTHWMEEAARRTGRGAQFFRTPIAVTLTRPGEHVTNRFGVTQTGCTSCGECDIGCNVGAKNTLDLNYLAEAERLGADALPGHEVVRLAEADGGYLLTVLDHADRTEHQVRADVVILAAGAVNTTELLLRARDEHATLPRLSTVLGTRFSGNGDFLAFTFDGATDFRAEHGPTITAAILQHEGPDSPWFVLEEGGFPIEIAGLVELLDSDDWFALGHEAPPQLRAELVERIRAAAAASEDMSPEETMRRRTGVFLAMGRDTADGELHLGEGPSPRPLRLRWPLVANLPLYDAEQRFCEQAAAAMGGETRVNPFWRFLRLPVTVHNLGGAVMAQDAADGVTDTHGEVFGYPNLFVFDGAALPEATGVNPSHTIAAAAERNVETLVRRLRADPGWRAPEFDRAEHYPDPLPPVPAGGTPPLPAAARLRSVGLRTQVQAVGRLHPVMAGAPDGTPCTLRLTLAAPSLINLLLDGTHPLAGAGTLEFGEGLGTGAPEGRFVVTKAVVNVLGEGVRWALPFFGADGTAFLLDGWSGGPVSRGPTAVRATVRRRGPDGERGTALAVGVLDLDLAGPLTGTRLFSPGPPAETTVARSLVGASS
jgi:cholesterol oxidase